MAHCHVRAEVVLRVSKGESPPFRPSAILDKLQGEDAQTPEMKGVLGLMAQCWAEPPHLRPRLTDIKHVLRGLNKGRSVHHTLL